MKLHPPDEVSAEDQIASPEDIQLFVRGGYVHLRTPNHGKDAPVPKDYLVLLGVSIVFGDPSFRNAMLALVDKAQDEGMLENVIVPHHGTVN
jgi:hypothetical protein